MMGQGMLINTWPTANGTITYSQYRQTHSSNGRTSSTYADIKFNYTVDGEIYDSRNVNIAGNTFIRDKDAYAYIAKYPVGKEVKVHYRKDFPQVAYLEGGYRPAMLIFLGIGALFSVSSLFIMFQRKEF
jgi:hypothetical protein